MQLFDMMMFVGGGLSCAVTSFLVSSFFKKPEDIFKRVEYALISGLGAVAICWLGCKYFPNRFDVTDSIPYSILIGLFGIGRILDWIAKKYGIETSEVKIENEPKN